MLCPRTCAGESNSKVFELDDSDITVLFMKSCGCNKGTSLVDNKRDIVFLALKSTDQSRAQLDIISRSRCRRRAAAWGFSTTTMIYKLVSSTKRGTEELISLTMSLIKIRKRSGPSMDPCGTPACMDAQSDLVPLKKTHCRRFDR